jgi:hypothetical protein
MYRYFFSGHAALSQHLPIRVVAKSKAWTVVARWNTGVVGSNPTRSMDICVRLFCVCVVLRVGRGPVTSWSPVQGVLPTVYRIKTLKRGQGPTKGCTAIIIKIIIIMQYLTMIPRLEETGWAWYWYTLHFRKLVNCPHHSIFWSRDSSARIRFRRKQKTFSSATLTDQLEYNQCNQQDTRGLLSWDQATVTWNWLQSASSAEGKNSPYCVSRGG